jgi:hypothetical protein
MLRHVEIVLSLTLLLMVGVVRMAPADPLTASSTATVTASVGATVSYQVMDTTTIEIHSNTEWRVTAWTPDGTVILAGEHTGDVPVRVDLPPGTDMYSVTATR